MPTGTIKSFDASRRFGFIARDDGKPDIFVHITAGKIRRFPIRRARRVRHRARPAAGRAREGRAMSGRQAVAADVCRALLRFARAENRSSVGDWLLSPSTGSTDV